MDLLGIPAGNAGFHWIEISPYRQAGPDPGEVDYPDGSTDFADLGGEISYWP
jgi:hypothetical protein